MQVRDDAARHPVMPADGGGGDYLTNGAVYEVKVIRTTAQTSFRIASDDGTPALFDARGFVTVDDSVPADWRVEATPDRLTLGPAQFLAPDFWEDYLDRDEVAVQLFERRQPASAWSELAEADYRAGWSAFETRYAFRASTSSDAWPGIREPADSVTFDLSTIFAEQGPRFAAAEAAINADALRAFVAALPGGAARSRS